MYVWGVVVRSARMLERAIVVPVVVLSLFYHCQLTVGTDLMIQVDPGKEECFFENAEVNQTLYVDYSVVGTNQGEMDINFQIADTRDRGIVTEFRKTESRHEIPISIPGYYRICFDNTFSHFSHKTVAFQVSTDSEGEGGWNDYDTSNFQPEEVYDVKINDIKSLMERVHVAFNKIEAVQDQFRLLESKDRSIAESNFERVNFWSFVFVFFLISIGLIQVIMLKSLFDPKYNIQSIVGKLKG